MIKETDGDRFEAMRSLNQELTFGAVKKEFDLRNVEFGPQQMRTLKLVDQDNLYSNLGLLLSDQCVHTINKVWGITGDRDFADVKIKKPLILTPAEFIAKYL